MPAAPRVRAADVFTPEQWAPFQSRAAWVGPLLVAHCWGVIALAVVAGVTWPVLIPLCVMVIGTRQLGLAILMHEAAHGGLSPNRRLNDFLGHWLCAVPVGASLTAYRPYHLAHHKHAQQAEDPDLVLSAPFPVSRASLRRKIVRDLTGRTFFKQRVLLPLRQAPFPSRGKGWGWGGAAGGADGARKTPASSSLSSQHPASTPTQPSPLEGEGSGKAEGFGHEYEVVVTGKSVVPFLLVTLGLLAVMALTGAWWAGFALWLLPLATWFPMVTRLRNIAEHACVEGSSTDPFRAARTTRASWWERAFIAPYWVNFHAEHHLFMHVPCWKLPALHRAVRATEAGARMEVAPGYAAVMREATGHSGTAQA